MDFRPSAFISSETDWAISILLKPVTATSYPSRASVRAVALPIPLGIVAPVTNASLLSAMISSLEIGGREFCPQFFSSNLTLPKALRNWWQSSLSRWGGLSAFLQAPPACTFLPVSDSGHYVGFNVCVLTAAAFYNGMLLLRMAF